MNPFDPARNQEFLGGLVKAILGGLTQGAAGVGWLADQLPYDMLTPFAGGDIPGGITGGTALNEYGEELAGQGQYEMGDSPVGPYIGALAETAGDILTPDPGDILKAGSKVAAAAAMHPKTVQAIGGLFESITGRALKDAYSHSVEGLPEILYHSGPRPLRKFDPSLSGSTTQAKNSALEGLFTMEEGVAPGFAVNDVESPFPTDHALVAFPRDPESSILDLNKLRGEVDAELTESGTFLPTILDAYGPQFMDRAYRGNVYDLSRALVDAAPRGARPNSLLRDAGFDMLRMRDYMDSNMIWGRSSRPPLATQTVILDPDIAEVVGMLQDPPGGGFQQAYRDLASYLNTMLVGKGFVGVSPYTDEYSTLSNIFGDYGELASTNRYRNMFENDIDDFNLADTFEPLDDPDDAVGMTVNEFVQWLAKKEDEKLDPMNWLDEDEFPTGWGMLKQ